MGITTFYSLKSNETNTDAVIKQIPQNAKTAILLNGDRINCCTHAAITTDSSNNLQGICTISPEGEMQSDPPTIVGLYVLKPYRNQGIATELLKTSLQWMIENQHTPVKIDAFSEAVSKITQKLPKDIQNQIILIDHNGVMDLMPE